MLKKKSYQVKTLTKLERNQNLINRQETNVFRIKYYN